MGRRISLTVLALDLGDTGNVTSTKSKRGSRKQEEYECPQEDGVRLEESHDCWLGCQAVVDVMRG